MMTEEDTPDGFIDACVEGDINTIMGALDNNRSFDIFRLEGLAMVYSAIHGHRNVITELAEDISIECIDLVIKTVHRSSSIVDKTATMCSAISNLVYCGANLDHFLYEESDSPNDGILFLLRKGYFSVAKHMQELGMDIRHSNGFMYELEELSKTKGSGFMIRRIKELVSLGLDVGSEKGHGQHLIFLADYLKKSDVLRYSLIIGATDLSNSRGSFNTALRDHGDRDIDNFKLLIESGANVEEETEETQNLIADALYSDNPLILRTILEAGALPYTRPLNGVDCFDHAKAECRRLILDRQTELDREQIVTIGLGLRELDLPVLVLTEICAAARICRPEARVAPVVEWDILKNIKHFS